MNSKTMMNTRTQIPIFVQLKTPKDTASEFINLSDCHKIIKYDDNSFSLYNQIGNCLGIVAPTEDNKKLLDLIA